MTETEAAVVAKAEAEAEAEARHDHGSQPAQAAGSEAEDTKEGAAVENEAGEGLALSEEAAAIVIGRYAKGYLSRKEVEAYKREREERRLREQREAEERAATRIGAAAKGRIQKKKFEELKSQRKAEGKKPATIDFEIALSRKFALKKVEAMSGAHGLDTMGGELLVATKKRVRAEVESWTGDQCSDFLTSVTAMRPYSSAFSAINGKAILRMSINSLSSIGITQFEHQRVIWAAVAELQQFCNQIEYVPADEVLSA